MARLIVLRQKIINRFFHGLINTIEDQALPYGAASNSINWLSLGDRIELRRGYTRLGSDDGAGAVTGLHVTRNNAGLAIPYKSYARKIKYYDSTLSTPDWVETGSNLLPAAASGEQVMFDNYSSLAGTQMLLDRKSVV